MYAPSDFCCMDALWMGSLPETCPLPLTQPVAIRILPDDATAAAAADGAAAAAGSTAAAAGDEGLPPGQLWSVRVAVYSGVAESALLSEDSKEFQVRVGFWSWAEGAALRVWVRQALL